MKNLVDTHVHTTHSHDGKASLEKVIAVAKEKGLCHLCTTEHVDYDFEYGKNKAPVKWEFLDVEKYYRDWQVAKQALNDDKNNTLNLCFGIEASFDKNPRVIEKYQELIDKYPFDEVINSVHCVDGYDVYFKSAFWFKTKKQVYSRYLQTIIDSLDAPYHFDIVAHVGYIAHGSPYKEKTLLYQDFPELIDTLLKKIIEKDKAMEVNFHHAMCPEINILKRYFELGGRKISYGSDAHRADVCKDFEIACAMLKDIGFSHLCTFVKRECVLVPIE